MAAIGKTAISLYYSATALAQPVSGRLVNGELALNTTDGKLYFKNSSGVVTLLADSIASTSSFSAGTTGFTPTTAISGPVTLSGTLKVNHGGTGVVT